MADGPDPDRVVQAAGSGLEAALARYNAERLPVVHRYQERSRAVSARTGRMRRPQVAAVKR